MGAPKNAVNSGRLFLWQRLQAARTKSPGTATGRYIHIRPLFNAEIYKIDLLIKFVCLSVSGACIHPIRPKTIFTFFVCFLVLRADACPSQGDYWLFPYPLNPLIWESINNKYRGLLWCTFKLNLKFGWDAKSEPIFCSAWSEFNTMEIASDWWYVYR